MKKAAVVLPSAAVFRPRLLVVLVLALLVCNTAAGLASGLARGLALAATAILGAEILSLDGFDMLHGDILHNIYCQVLYHNICFKSIQTAHSLGKSRRRVHRGRFGRPGLTNRVMNDKIVLYVPS